MFAPVSPVAGAMPGNLTRKAEPMNDQPNPADFALAMYATACETHMRRDWREACHALAKALRQELESSASRATLATAAPMPQPVAKPRTVKAAKAPADSFNMTAGSLTTALRMLVKVSAARSTIPILSTVLMQAAGDVLTLTCTDLDKALSLDVNAPGIGDWQAAPNVRHLLAMVAKAPKGETVTLYQANTHGVGINIAGVVRSLDGLPPADFPTMDPGELYPLDLDGAELLEALRFVSPAMSTEEARFYLNGAYLARPMINGTHRLHVVATDGHRLHRWEGEPGTRTANLTTAGKAPPIIIPRDTVKAILAMGGDGAGLTMAGNAKYVTATAGPARLTSRLIDGSFPDYMRVIPTRDAFTMTADRAGLASAVANVATICDDKAGAVKFGLAHAAGSLGLSARNTVGGKAAAHVTVKASAKAWGKAHGKKGETPPAAPDVIEWGFNSAYVKDALASLTGPTVTVDGMDSASPFRVSCADDGRRLVVLMPVRL